MGYIKKKQVLGLLEDLAVLQAGMPLLKRTVSFGGNPVENQSTFESADAEEIETVKIHTTDSTLGNSYSQLNDISVGDTLILKDENDNISIYKIDDITSEVDSSNEGYFILTVQHSFGYNGSFQAGEFIHYFRRVPSSSITQSIANEETRAISSETSIQSSLDNEISTRLSQNASLLAITDAETTARISGDLSLSDKLDNENSERLAQDASLLASTEAETAARISADLSLDNKIEAIPSINKFVSLVTLEEATTVVHNLNTTDVIIQLVDADGVSVVGTYSDYQLNSVVIAPRSSGVHKVIIIG